MKNKYEIRGDVTVILLKNGDENFEMFIDTEDFNKVLSICGNTTIKPTRSNGGYYGVIQKYQNSKRETYRIHRIIMDPPAEMVVDHINRNSLDNRKSNLRIISYSDNHQNLGTRKDNNSGERGVSWHSRLNKWIARIQIDGKRVSLGAFDNKNEAVSAVRKYRSKFMPFSQDGLNPTKEDLKLNAHPYGNDKSSGIRNVSWNKNNRKWTVYKRVDGKPKYFGSYEKLEDAIKKADEVTGRSTP